MAAAICGKNGAKASCQPEPMTIGRFVRPRCAAKKVLVCWKITIGLKRGPQVVGVTVRVCIVVHLDVTKLSEKVPKVCSLSTTHQLLRQVRLLKAHMPESRMTQNLRPPLGILRKNNIANDVVVALDSVKVLD